jgi:hypothetical protein
MELQNLLPLTTILLLGALGVYRLTRMVLPVFLGMAAPAHGGNCHAAGLVSANAATAAAATVVHGAGYLIVTAAAAWVVFTKIGVGVLRRAWFNLDLIWAIALIGRKLR